MRHTIKSAFLLMAFAVCLLGVFFTPKAAAPERQPKTHAVPVKNTQPHRGIWLRV